MEYLKITDFTNKDQDKFCAAIRIEKTEQTIDRTSDHTLAEYLPDAKKIVSYSATPTIETRYIGNGSLEYSGNLLMSVLYSTESGELSDASFTIPFENRLTSDGITEGTVDFITPSVVSSSCRLQNPRKIKVNARICVDIEVWRRKCFLPELYGASQTSIEGLETDPTEYNGINITSLSDDDMTLEDDIVIDKSLPDISKIVSSLVNISFDECRSSRGEIIMKGGADISCTYLGNDDKYHSLRRFLPMTESLTSRNANDDSFCSCNVSMKSSDITFREDEFGQMRILELKSTYAVTSKIINRTKVLLTSDAYSSKSEVIAEHDDVDIFSCEDKTSANFSVNESFLLKDCSIGSDDSIVSFEPCGKIGIMHEPGKHGKIAFEGKCSLKVIAKKPDDTLYSETIEIPLHYESDKKYKNDLEYEDITICRISDMRVRNDGEKLYADFEVLMSSIILSKNKMTLLSAIRLVQVSPADNNEKAEMTVFFTSPSDDIWSVAKRYRVSRCELSKLNDLKGEQLPEFLFIPRKR